MSADAATAGQSLTPAELVAAALPAVRILARSLAARLAIDVEDAEQELLLLVIRRARQFDPSRASVGTFARLQARWLICSRMRRHDRLVAHDFEPPSRDRGPDQAAEANDDVSRLLDAMERLDERSRHAVKLRYGVGCAPVSQREMCVTIGVRRSQGHSILHAALQALAVALGADPSRVRVAIEGASKASVERRRAKLRATSGSGK